MNKNGTKFTQNPRCWKFLLQVSSSLIELVNCQSDIPAALQFQSNCTDTIWHPVKNNEIAVPPILKTQRRIVHIDDAIRGWQISQMRSAPLSVATLSPAVCGKSINHMIQQVIHDFSLSWVLSL